MSVRFIADLHYGHENMAKRRGFNYIEEHNEYLISQWNSIVEKKDLIYVLGDITMEKDNYEFFNRLKGQKHVILGNHDKLGHVRNMLNYVNHVGGMIRYSQKRGPKVFLTHCPIHPSELEYRVSYNIHGHIHENSVMINNKKDKRYICVSCEHLDFKPISYSELFK